MLGLLELSHQLLLLMLHLLYHLELLLLILEPKSPMSSTRRRGHKLSTHHALGPRVTPLDEIVLVVLSGHLLGVVLLPGPVVE